MKKELKMKNDPDHKVRTREKELAILTQQTEQFEGKFKKSFQLMFINIGLGKQKNAKNFVVSLNDYMSIEEIIRRVKVGFEGI